MTDYLFVYGTLKKNLHNELHPFLLGRADFLDKAAMSGVLYDVGAYPAAFIPSPECQTLIYGELYRLHDPEALLRILDDYEECSACFPEPHEYQRKLALITRTDSCKVNAWVYLYNLPVSGLRPIADGNFQPSRF